MSCVFDETKVVVIDGLRIVSSSDSVVSDVSRIEFCYSDGKSYTLDYRSKEKRDKMFDQIKNALVKSSMPAS